MLYVDDVSTLKKEKAMKHLIVLLTVGLVFVFNTGCASGPLDWVRRNTISSVFEVDQEKVTNNLARQIENWPTTKLILKNDAAIKSVVILEYEFPAWIDPATGRVLPSRFQLKYDIAPQSKRSVKIPAQVMVKIKVINHCNRKSFRKEISSGSALFNTVINVTPPGADKIWRAENKKVLVTFFNPARSSGKLIVEKLDSGEYVKEVSTYGDYHLSMEKKSLNMIKGKTHTETVKPGAIASVYLTQGYYKLSLLGDRSFHKKVQVANGRFLDEWGKVIPNTFSFYLPKNVPSVIARKLNVPHSH